MKTTLRILAIVAALAAISPTTFALVTPPNDLPDGGATALLLGMGAVGLVAARKFLKK